MSAVIKGAHPSMPPEHVEFVSGFADGYVRLGLLAAAAVARTPGMTLLGLIGLGEVRLFLDRMLGPPGSRRVLHVLAIMTKVGWYDDLAEEGQAVSRHFGLTWEQVQDGVQQFHRQFSIAPQGGRYRYISPTPLAIYLAAEAWATYRDTVKSLPGVLPSDDAREAYYDRLSLIANNPHARELALEELSFFLR